MKSFITGYFDGDGGEDCVVGIRICYEMGGLGLESLQRRECFILYRSVQTCCGAHRIGYRGSFSGGGGG
jgi:hypothetical protein